MDKKLFLAVFVDKDYKQILIVKANSLEEAEQDIINDGWDDSFIRLEEVKFNNNVALIFNGS